MGVVFCTFYFSHLSPICNYKYQKHTNKQRTGKNRRWRKTPKIGVLEATTRCRDESFR